MSSQTPRTNIEKRAPIASTANISRQSSMSRNFPQNKVQKVINSFLANKDGNTLSLKVNKDLASKDTSKLKNYKGIAIEVDATQKAQKQASGIQTLKASAENSVSAHNRRYKSDYLNSLTNNQNVPTSLLHQGHQEHQERHDRRNAR